MKVHITAAAFAVVLLFVCVAHASTTCPEKTSGIVKWSAWSGKPTSDGATVTVAATDVILLDVSPPYIDHMDVFGTLVVDPTASSIQLNISSLYVQKGGIFYIGSEACPLSNSVTITLFGTPQPGVDPVGLGTKVLGVLNGGTLEIHGKPRKPVWTVLSATAQANATQITLIEDVDWAVGETIVIATTDFEEFDDDPNYPPTQNEQVVITGRPSSTTVTFSPPLKYMHYGKIWTGTNGDTVDMRGEVGLVSRNILIRGDVNSSLSGDSFDKNWGGHVMMRDGGVGRIEYVEVTKLGQKGEFGRYPLHFHNSSTQPNSYLRGNSIHDTFQRCIVVHSTFNLRVINNFAYRGVGHCYFIEDGNEEQNVFEHNLGVKALVGTLLTADSEPAVYWITNPNNHFYDNVAVGGKMGFWYSMPVHPLALSDSQVDVKLRFKPNGDFVGNKAHSANVGLFVDRGLENAKPGAANDESSYSPTNWTLSLALAQKLGISYDLNNLDDYTLSTLGYRSPAHFVDFTAYKCVEEGMWGRGSFMHSYGAKLADNVIGCVWPGNANLMQNTIMVGETDNVGNYNIVPNTGYIWWGDEEGRSRPTKYFMANPITGYSSYDAGGGDLVMDINFHNFNDYTFTLGTNTGQVRKTGAITGISGPNVIEPLNRIYRANFFNVQNRVYIREYYPWDPQLDMTNDAVKGIVWVDGDGSVLKGLPEAGCGKKIVGAGPLVRQSGCVQKSDWNAWICPADTNAYRPVYFSQDTTVSGGNNETTFRVLNDLHIQRLSDNAILDVEADIQNQGTYLTATYHYGTNLLTGNAYYVTFGNSNKILSNFEIQSTNMVAGELIILAFPFPSTATLTVTSGYDAQGTVTQVSGVSALTYNSYYWDSTNGLLWIGLGTTDINYEYYYGIPLVSSAALIWVDATSCADSSELCTYKAGQTAPHPTLNIPSHSINLCETGGAITGGVYQYSSKSSASKVIFDDAFVSPFVAGDVAICNITSAVYYEGTSSLHCVYTAYQWNAWTRDWSSHADVVSIDSYTHLQFAIKVAPGYGDITMAALLINSSYAQLAPTQYIHNPAYTDNAGPITDSKWTVVRIPISQLSPSGSNIWGMILSSSANRPMEIYVDSIKFVSLNQQLNAISNFPVAPAKPALVGPGPQASYPTDDSGSGNFEQSSSEGAKIQVTFLSFLSLMVFFALVQF